MLASQRSISRQIEPDKRVSVARRKPHLNQRPSPDLFQWAGVLAPHRDIAPPFDPRKAVRFALGIWHTAIAADHAILAERWCTSQSLRLPDDCGSVVRFHANLKFGNDRAPGLIWLLRDLHTDEPTGILRLYLDEAGSVIGRRTLGRVWNATIKLSADAEVTSGLFIASTVERGLAAMAQGYRPLWVINALADFPLLPGIECLTVIAGPDDDTDAVAARWRAADRDVIIINETPPPAIWDAGSGDP